MITFNKNNYNFNPFAGEETKAILQLINPIVKAKDILAYISANPNCAIELCGEKGLGKTTHLHYLHQKIQGSLLADLDDTSLENILKSKVKIILIDSINLFDFYTVFKLFRTNKTIIYTTHRSRKFTAFITGKKLKTINFKPITAQILQTIITNRLLLAQKSKEKVVDLVSTKSCDALIQQYGTNHRTLINKLYEIYQWDT